ncbi:hypothetical protein [Marinospirillum insulare]|uniref:Uncharacterized protein n=1 Tax=Marinospirillum insulare TaxID=217169 RepID=A0ABQ5ZX88_9GAMM|nr:hypothetical protein [Marinospirillum insulare]GLR63953.1 hypothetical protein GCM10007878_13910 [Marinospirillum insulare]
MPTPRIIMYEKLTAFSNEKKVSVSSREKTGGAAKGSYAGSIGLKIKALIDNHGQTLKSINHYLSLCLSENISLNTMYSWSKGATPRDTNKATAIEQSLDIMIAETPKISGGTWCSRSEVKNTLQALQKHLSTTEMHIATDVPITTIQSWLDGLHRVERSRFSKFKKDLTNNFTIACSILSKCEEQT